MVFDRGGSFRCFGQRARAPLFALVASMVLLAGCNNALGTEKPWFTKSDSDGSLRLKPGYWVLAECPNNLPRAVCATAQVVVTSSDLHLPASSKQVWLKERSIPFIVIAGDPVLIQVELHLPPKVRDEPGRNVFFYAGFAPSARDGDGKVIAGEVWPVTCGPAPRPGDQNYAYQDDQGQVTDHPLPGLKMAGGGCDAEGREALTNAARATRTIDGAPIKVEWKSLTPLKQPQ